MQQLTTIQCPKCGKIYITPIVLKKTISGARPTLLFPKEYCDGLVFKFDVDGYKTDETETCNLKFTSLPVESFDINLNEAEMRKIERATKQAQEGKIIKP